MMDRFEQQLKEALRREEPPPGFAARVATRARNQQPGSWWRELLTVSRIRWAVPALLCVLIFGGILLQHEKARERAEGEAAKQQVMLALQIAGTKVRLAQSLVQQINEKSPGREQ